MQSSRCRTASLAVIRDKNSRRRFPLGLPAITGVHNTRGESFFSLSVSNAHRIDEGRSFRKIRRSSWTCDSAVRMQNSFYGGGFHPRNDATQKGVTTPFNARRYAKTRVSSENSPRATF